jgi:dihydroneopterin aldolase/2-amino-4-hydroxy-6-hydroxymethyldihydropteridine diphosphokinase/dihydropteroate synthase
VADGAQWPSATSAPVRQPVRVSISVPYDLRPAAAADDISKSINYGSLSKRVLASVEEHHAPAPAPTRQCQFRSLEQLSGHIFATCFDAFPEIRQMTLDVVKPRAIPYADAVRVLSSRARDGSRLASEHFSIQRLACNVIVGLNPCEREDKQLVCFDVDVVSTHHLSSPSSSPIHPQNQPQKAPDLNMNDDSPFDFRGLAKDIRQVRATVLLVVRPCVSPS